MDFGSSEDTYSTSGESEVGGNLSQAEEELLQKLLAKRKRGRVDDDDDSTSTISDPFKKSGRNKAFLLGGTVPVAEPIADQLEEHQKEGLLSLWRNCFEDTVDRSKGSDVGGCVLAHEMVSLVVADGPVLYCMLISYIVST